MINAKLAFISGAGSGLGRELAYLLAKKGIPLLITSKDPAKLKDLEYELRELTSVFSFPADLSVPQDVEALLEEIRRQQPDLIINNAAIGLYGEILSFPLQKQMEILQVNVQALTQISIESARLLKESQRKGVIMNISSAAGLFTYPSFALYAASKRFVQEFSLSFDEELSPHGIRVLTALIGRFHSSFRYNASLHKSSSSISWDVMPLEVVTRAILQQIEKKKRVRVIDWRYKILCAISKLIPRRWLAFLLKKGIDRML